MQAINIKMLPSVITLGNLFCGFLAIAYIADGRIDAAAALIFVGMVFDMLDGKVARFTHTSSDFGVQLDSLADMITFGVAPAFLIKVYMLESPLVCQPKIAWMIGLLFVICAALRLARFNVKTGHDEESHTHFEGLATPAASGLLASCILATHSASQVIPEMYYKSLVLFIALSVSILMVSKFRYVHMGMIFLKKNRAIHGAIIAMVLMITLLLEPQVFVVILTCCFLLYAMTGPFVSFYQILFAQDDEQEFYLPGASYKK